MILGILAVFTVYFFWANRRQRKNGKFIEGTVCFFFLTPFPHSPNYLSATFAYFFFFLFSGITGRFSIYVLINPPSFSPIYVNRLRVYHNSTQGFYFGTLAKASTVEQESCYVYVWTFIFELPSH